MAERPGFYLPDFCRAQSVLAVILIAALVALLFALAADGISAGFWTRLARIALFLLWVALGTANVDTVMPASAGPRYICVYGGNGSVNVNADYVRFTPDSPNDVAPPVSSHTVPAADGADGWHRTPVSVTLAAADDGECVSGIDRTEYRIGTGAFASYTAPIALAAEATGRARIETYTVMHDRDGAPMRGLVIGRLDADGRRFLANTPEDRTVLEGLMATEGVGRAGCVAVRGDVNRFEL